MTWTFQLNSAWISNGPSCPKNQDIVCFRIFRQISPERQKQILPRHLPGKDILLTSAAGIIHSRQRRLMDSKRRNTPRIVCTPSPPGAYDRAGDRARLSSRRPLGTAPRQPPEPGACPPEKEVYWRGQGRRLGQLRHRHPGPHAGRARLRPQGMIPRIGGTPPF